MALLFFTGFENLTSRLTGLFNDGSSAFNSSVGRHGGKAIEQTGSAATRYADIPIKVTPGSSTIIVGYAIYLTSQYTAASERMCEVTLSCEAGGTCFHIRRDTAGAGGVNYAVYNSANVKIAGSEFAMGGLETWTYVEVKAFCHPSAGTMEVRVDGTTVWSGSGLSIQSGGLPDTFDLACYRYGRYDDFYFCDDTGATHNDFLGPVKITGHLPIADIAKGFTSTNGSTHYTELDEVSFDTTTYVTATTGTGITDTFTVEPISLSGGEQIAAVRVNAIAKTTSAGAAPLSLIANNQESASVLTSASDHIYSLLTTTSDGTNGWTESSFNSAAFGIKAAVE